MSSTNGFLEIRGGSADQTGTFINGLGYNNAAVGNAETIVPLSAIDQVSLLSGGFNAEYGNFRSGFRFAVGAMPSEPESAAARSERMSACRFVATITSMVAGFRTIRVVMASTSSRSCFTSG